MTKPLRTHFMLDVETLDTATTAIVTSIGLVAFNQDEIVDTIEIHLSIDEQVEQGRTLSASTLIFWLSASEAARDILTKGQNNPSSVADGLSQINSFIYGNTEDVQESKLFGNGVLFDNGKLASLYDGSQVDPVLPYWTDQCYRTIAGCHPNTRIDRSKGVHHSAVDDAEAQALHLMHLSRLTGLYL